MKPRSFHHRNVLFWDRWPTSSPQERRKRCILYQLHQGWKCPSVDISCTKICDKIGGARSKPPCQGSWIKFFFDIGTGPPLVLLLLLHQNIFSYFLPSNQKIWISWYEICLLSKDQGHKQFHIEFVLLHYS